MLYTVILKIRHEGFDSSQSVISSCNTAAFLINQPMQISQDIIPVYISKYSLVCFDMLFISQVNKQGYKSIPISRNCIDANISFVGQIYTEEPRELFCKVIRCHVLCYI